MAATRPVLRTDDEIRAAGAEAARRMKPLTDTVLDKLAVVLAPLAPGHTERPDQPKRAA